MAKPIIKIATPPTKYDALRTLGQTVVASMTGNLSFPTPSPLLATVQSATTALSNAITAWGTKGSRGSHQDLVNLRGAATTLRNLLLQEAAYVANLVDLNADPLTQQAFILSSGFSVKNARTPQGILQAVQNFHNFVSRQLNPHQVKLKWKKPLNVAVNGNVKVFNVYRSATGLFADATFIGSSTKTTFTDSTPVLGAQNTYFVIAVNTVGNGVTSNGVTVSVPA